MKITPVLLLALILIGCSRTVPDEVPDYFSGGLLYTSQHGFGQSFRLPNGYSSLTAVAFRIGNPMLDTYPGNILVPPDKITLTLHIAELLEDGTVSSSIWESSPLTLALTASPSYQWLEFKPPQVKLNARKQYLAWFSQAEETNGAYLSFTHCLVPPSEIPAGSNNWVDRYTDGTIYIRRIVPNDETPLEGSRAFWQKWSNGSVADGLSDLSFKLSFVR